MAISPRARSQPGSLPGGGGAIVIPRARSQPGAIRLPSGAVWTPADFTGGGAAAKPARQPLQVGGVASEDETDVVSRWYGTVTALDALTPPKAAQVRLAGDDSSVWVPLEVSGVAVDDDVRIDFEPEGVVAVTAILQ
jgi:hypothetical protein